MSPIFKLVLFVVAVCLVSMFWGFVPAVILLALGVIYGVTCYLLGVRTGQSLPTEDQEVDADYDAAASTRPTQAQTDDLYRANYGPGSPRDGHEL